MKFIFSFAISILFCLVDAEVTVVRSVQTIYARSPKLRIKGEGFPADEKDIIIEIGSVNAPLRQGKDFVLSKIDDGIILKLLTNRRWVDLDKRTPPVGLIVSSVSTKQAPDTNLLPESIIVANVIETPTIRSSEEVIYQTASNELEINGTGFAGAKFVDLYFQPPLLKEIAYEVVDWTSTRVVLRLRHGYKWAEEPGPLALVGVDTGGGPLRLGEDDFGIRVAEVQADLDVHGVTVVTTAPTQSVYNDDPVILVQGEGFNLDGNQLRFANGLLGKGVNFTALTQSETAITLRLSPGSHWRRNVDNLPGYLTLLAVNAGGGFVAVGPTNAMKGVDLAKVFERPVLYSSLTKIYRTHSHELHLKGQGFPRIMSVPRLRFASDLRVDRDYTIRVVDRTDMELTLVDGREWAAAGVSELVVTHINTRDDEAGWIKLPGDGVHVALVAEDVAGEATGGLEVYPAGTKMYQSALQQTLEISGAGFKQGMKFTFAPALREGTDYTLQVNNKNRVTLQLLSGRRWAPEAGFLMATTVSTDGVKFFPLAEGQGIRVAVILGNPSVEVGADNIHETQSKVIAIHGQGFTNVMDVKVRLSPTIGTAYKLLSVSDDTIRLQLKEDFDWLPSFLTIKDDATKIPLTVVSIDTGAGEVSLPGAGVAVGQVVRDREGVYCDDSCEFSFDGVCDDGSEDVHYYYDDMTEYYGDDDLGGYYGEGGDDQGPGENAYGEGSYQYDDYYMETDEFQVSACLKGTDCTDCGGVDAIVDGDPYGHLPLGPDGERVSCTNTCPYARDGQCDDPRGANYCILGTDCQDCGEVGKDNFTSIDDDGWWDDDDDYWSFNDGNFLEQAKGLEPNRHKVPKVIQTESAGAAVVFLTMLEGMVYTIGAVFGAAGLYVVMRWYNGQSLPFMHVFNPDSSQSMTDLELAPSRRMAITPDVIRT